MKNMPGNIAIDMGNSSIKVGLFQNSRLTKDWVFQTHHEVVSAVVQSGAKRIMICSVVPKAQDLIDGLGSFDINVLSSSTPIPFKNHYKTKSTLGADRIAALAGAEKINGGKNNLIIDIGSCITYDFLDKDNLYHGGSISPGIDLRFKAMNDHAQRLPMITEFGEAKLIGKSTNEAMISGVINGILAELNGIIGQYKITCPDLEVIVCGRGLNSFGSNLKAYTFVSPKLVLIGLNRILEYNEQS